MATKMKRLSLNLRNILLHPCSPSYKGEEAELWSSAAPARPPRKEPCDAEGFTKVVRKNVKPSFTNQCGTASGDHLFRAEVPTTQIYVSRVHYDVKFAEVVEYIKRKAGVGLKVEKLDSRHNLIWTSLRVGDGYSCPYGQSCGFEPAPPGRSPACAQPGLTYCVHPQPYPEKIIRSLIEAGQYDIRTLLSDETRDDFAVTKKAEYPYEYGPNSLPHVDQISLVNDFPKDFNKFHTRYNHDIFSHKTPLQPPSPAEPTPYNINYQAANFSKFGFHGYTAPGNYWQPGYNYEKKNGYNLFDGGYPSYPSYDDEWLRQAQARAVSGVTRYNPSEWWKFVSPSRSDVTVERSVTFPTRTSSGRKRKRRNAALVEAASKRTLSGAEALRIALGLASAETSAERPRRQAGGLSMSLCSVRTEFITPRAALNNKGSWKYVVNMPDNMTQLVKAEICTSTECNGLCSVPRGYTSKCEQKYIQKRLVALQASGQNLYTDVFWIPSCCQCTITPAN